MHSVVPKNRSLVHSTGGSNGSFFSLCSSCTIIFNAVLTFDRHLENWFINCFVVVLCTCSCTSYSCKQWCVSDHKKVSSNIDRRYSVYENSLSLCWSLEFWWPKSFQQLVSFGSIFDHCVSTPSSAYLIDRMTNVKCSLFSGKTMCVCVCPLPISL